LIHFGINGAELLNVYAWDVARLPEWEQQIWSAHNVTPEGGLSDELHSAQVRTKVAETAAPEQGLLEMRNLANDACLRRWGTRLFRAHGDTESIAGSCHRFRALPEGGLLSLAKDLSRILIDALDLASLQTLAPPPAGAKWGSLKSLEAVLALDVGVEAASRLMAPLFGLYELRLADAHLPGGGLEDSLAKLWLKPETSRLRAGEQLIGVSVSFLVKITQIWEEFAEIVGKI
jgi:hypothetical protein